MKKTPYFSHDYNARNDPKIQNILMKMGHEGFYLYWCLVETMYEQEGRLLLADCEGLAWQLRTTPDKIHQLIDLAFKKDSKYFFSNSVLERLKLKEEKSEKARESVSKRWERNTNVLPTYRNNDTNVSNIDTVKESKVKENKVNKSKVKERESVEENEKPLVALSPPNQEFFIEEKKYEKLSDLIEEDFDEIAGKYGIPIAFVRSKYDDMVLWAGQRVNNPRTKGRNWRLTLMNWVKRDGQSIMQHEKDISRKGVKAYDATQVVHSDNRRQRNNFESGGVQRDETSRLEGIVAGLVPR